MTTNGYIWSSNNFESKKITSFCKTAVKRSTEGRKSKRVRGGTIVTVATKVEGREGYQIRRQKKGLFRLFCIMNIPPTARIERMIGCGQWYRVSRVSALPCNFDVWCKIFENYSNVDEPSVVFTNNIYYRRHCPIYTVLTFIDRVMYEWRTFQHIYLNDHIPTNFHNKVSTKMWLVAKC